MKALSFHQPRAEQVVRGDKTLDVRSWQVSYRGVLAVHASRERRDDRCRALGLDPDALAYGALVGTVEVTGIVALDEEAYEGLRERHRLETVWPGAPCYGWWLANPQCFETPIPCRGHMRLFEAGAAQALGSADPSLRSTASSPGVRPVELEPQAVPTLTRAARKPLSNYHLTSAVEADPQRPFVLAAIPEERGGYRVVLAQWVQRHRQPAEPAAGELWSIELGGDALRGVADHLLAALRANGYRATDLARATGAGEPFYLDELSGLRLALILMAVRPLTRPERIEAIGLGVQAMSPEEAYYWFSKCSAGPGAQRAQRALRLLMSED